jgi:hypothetical protein
VAIKTEFPKFNSAYNGHRHPIQELTASGRAVLGAKLALERKRRNRALRAPKADGGVNGLGQAAESGGNGSAP